MDATGIVKKYEKKKTGEPYRTENVIIESPPR
jgi:hypothetical protein